MATDASSSEGQRNRAASITRPTRERQNGRRIFRAVIVGNVLLLSVSSVQSTSGRTPFGVTLRCGAADAVSITGTENASLDDLEFGVCRPGDGHEEDPDGIPRRFLRMQKGNRDRAKKALEATAAWRQKLQVDTILTRPHDQFDQCKRIFPHYFLGTIESLEGDKPRQVHPVFLQRPGQIDLDIGDDFNVTMPEVLSHYVYMMEYCWNVWMKDYPEATLVNLIDCTGISWEAVLSEKKRHFVLSFVGTMSDHYPQRSYKTIILNAPTWFSAFYKLVTPLLRESTRRKISIFTAGDPRARQHLKELLGSHVELPPELFTATEKRKKKKKKHNLEEEEETESLVSSPLEGAQTTQGAHFAAEKDFRQFCMERLQQENMEMKPAFVV